MRSPEKTARTNVKASGDRPFPTDLAGCSSPRRKAVATMLFQARFDQFSYEEFYAFLRTLTQRYRFWNILFEPATGLPNFTRQQLTHAAPNNDISHPDSFIGQWKKKRRLGEAY
jgi:hypothetical protein